MLVNHVDTISNADLYTTTIPTDISSQLGEFNQAMQQAAQESVESVDLGAAIGDTGSGYDAIKALDGTGANGVMEHVARDPGDFKDDYNNYINHLAGSLNIATDTVKSALNAAKDSVQTGEQFAQSRNRFLDTFTAKISEATGQTISSAELERYMGDSRYVDFLYAYHTRREYDVELSQETINLLNTVSLSEIFANHEKYRDEIRNMQGYLATELGYSTVKLSWAFDEAGQRAAADDNDPTVFFNTLKTELAMQLDIPENELVQTLGQIDYATPVLEGLYAAHTGEEYARQNDGWNTLATVGAVVGGVAALTGVGIAVGSMINAGTNIASTAGKGGDGLDIVFSGLGALV